MKKIWNFLPIEFYILFIPSIFIFLFSFFWLKSLSIDAFGVGVGGFLKDYLDIDSPFTMSILILLAVFFFGIIFEPCYFFLFNLLFPGPATVPVKKWHLQIRWERILSIFLIVIVISFVSYSLTLFTNLLFKIANPSEVGSLSIIALSWDKAIFGTYPGIWLIGKFGGTFWETVLLGAYNSIFFLLSLVLICSFLFKKNAFRKLVMSFFLSWMIALPIWFLFPIIPPDFMFRLDTLHMATLQEHQAFNAFALSPLLKSNFAFQEKVHVISQNPAKRLLPTSTFPSMHAAWGIVIVYAGMLLCPWLGLVLIPWAIFNGIGAVYILEHFALDIVSGTMVALVSITITEWLFSFEGKYFEDRFGLLSGFDYIPSILRRFRQDIDSFLNHF